MHIHAPKLPKLYQFANGIGTCNELRVGLKLIDPARKFSFCNNTGILFVADLNCPVRVIISFCKEYEGSGVLLLSLCAMASCTATKNLRAISTSTGNKSVLKIDLLKIDHSDSYIFNNRIYTLKNPDMQYLIAVLRIKNTSKTIQKFNPLSMHAYPDSTIKNEKGKTITLTNTPKEVLYSSGDIKDSIIVFGFKRLAMAPFDIKPAEIHVREIIYIVPKKSIQNKLVYTEMNAEIDFSLEK